MLRYISRICASVVACLGLCGASLAQGSEGVVRIGVLTDMSGPFADLSGAGEVSSVKMAVEDFGGRVLGMPIEVMVADHQNRPDTGITIARRWLDREHVDAIVGGPNSAVALGVQALTDKNRRIFLNLGSAAADLSGKACSRTAFHWTTDTYAMAISAKAILKDAGSRNWFTIAPDFAFGHALEKEVAGVIRSAGGKVVGSVRTPLNNPDFASYILQAQTSGANVLGLALVGQDLVSAVKQARDFGVGKGSLKLVSLAANVSDVKAIGLPTAQGLLVGDSWYWDLDDPARAWTQRWSARNGGKVPTQEHAADYSATMHYLKAVAAAGTDEGEAVARKMRELPVEDFYARKVRIREDGRLLRDFYLFKVKSPANSKGPNDLYERVERIPGEQAARPVAESECPLFKEAR